MRGHSRQDGDEDLRGQGCGEPELCGFLELTSLFPISLFRGSVTAIGLRGWPRLWEDGGLCTEEPMQPIWEQGGSGEASLGS